MKVVVLCGFFHYVSESFISCFASFTVLYLCSVIDSLIVRVFNMKTCKIEGGGGGYFHFLGGGGFKGGCSRTLWFIM